MTKPMLIEALKPGMRAKLGNGEEVWRTENYIRSETITKISNVAYLTSVDYEIIPDEPKPWTPTEGDMGYTMCRDFDTVVPCEIVYAGATKTKQAAEHKAKLDRIFTAILNMPGYGGDGAHVYSSEAGYSCTRQPPLSINDFPFDTYENANAAADYANKLMEASHA